MNEYLKVDVCVYFVGSGHSQVQSAYSLHVVILPAPRDRDTKCHGRMLNIEKQMCGLVSWPGSQWQRSVLQCPGISFHNQKWGQKNQFGQESPRSGNWQRNCWTRLLCRSYWCSPGTGCRWGTFYGIPPSGWRISRSDGAPSTEYEVWSLGSRSRWSPTLYMRGEQRRRSRRENNLPTEAGTQRGLKGQFSSNLWPLRALSITAVLILFWASVSCSRTIWHIESGNKAGIRSDKHLQRIVSSNILCPLKNPERNTDHQKTS